MRTKLSLVLLVTILLCSLIGCGKEKITLSVDQPTETIRIGVAATLTGVGAYQGQQEMRGLSLAREKINQSGGINGKQIELVIEDSQALPEQAVKITQKLVTADKVKFIIGDSWSSTTVVMAPITNQSQVLLMSPVALLDALGADDLFFRTMPVVNNMMRELAEYVYAKMGARRIGILRQATPFGVEHASDFKIEFEKLGGQITSEESFGLTQTDLRTEILKIKSLGPDTIFNLHATGPMLGVLIKQARESGVKVNWISSFGAQNAPLVKEFGGVVEGLIYPYPYDESSELESVRKFVNLYQAKYNELPDLTAANSYDALMLLAQAIDQAGEDPLTVKKYLLQVTDYPGASGILALDKNGDVEKPIIIKQIKNGKFIKADE